MIHQQLQQFINLVILLLLGKYVAHLYLPWSSIVFLMLFALSLEYSIIYYRYRKLSFVSYSSLSTSIGVMLMMATPHLWIMLVMISLALLQKHLIRYGKYHLFNPSNFAIIMGLLFFYDETHIIVGQLGEHLWLEIFIMLLGIAILVRVDRWIIPVVFGLVYLLAQYYYIVNSDPVLIMQSIYWRFYSLSFIVFILFMLTDPQTTPKSIAEQISFAIILAIGTTWMDYHYGYRVQHLYMVLFLLSPMVVLARVVSRDIKLYIMIAFIVFLSLNAIIVIENQPPYYYEMAK